MSGAFLAPESNLHLQFAYYQSSLVVEHLTERFGLEAIRNILKDLGEGVEINAAIAKHTEPLDKLETAFRAYAVAKAKALAPELDWTKPDPETLRTGVEEFAKKHPKNFYPLVRQARTSVERQGLGSRQGAMQGIDQAVPAPKKWRQQSLRDARPRSARVGGISGRTPNTRDAGCHGR